jgi:RimJ/RimL family protein N-acetyltransferase
VGVLVAWLLGVELMLLCARPKGQVLLRALDGIETPRLRLRRGTPQDTDAVQLTMDDEALERTGLVERPDPKVWMKNTGYADRRLLVAWTVVTDRHSGEVLGVLGCYPKPARPHACLLGWWMGPNGRDQGYELEVVGAAVGALHSVGAIANVYFVGRGTYPDTLQVLHDIGAVETTGPPVPVADGSRASLWFVHAAPAAPPVR